MEPYDNTDRFVFKDIFRIFECFGFSSTDFSALGEASFLGSLPMGDPGRRHRNRSKTKTMGRRKQTSPMVLFFKAVGGTRSLSC
jgi:hypothetical protein